MFKPTPVYCVHPIKLWAPLALALMASSIEAELSDTYQIVYPFALTEQQLIEQVSTNGPGIVLCSNYMWTREANLEISARIKRFSPQSIVIHGGPDTPAYPEACKTYLERYPFIDYAVHGEGEQTLIDLLKTLANKQNPEQVAGIGFLQKETLIKTAARLRSPDPNLFPSPYLNGVFDKLEWKSWNAITLETNRGCPYACTFCDWGSATMQKMRCFEIERIRAEIEWMAQHKIPKLWIADSNFGIFERDLEITEIICELKERYGYPRLVITNYAKNTKQHLVDIIEMLVEHGLVGTGIVSLQTRDQETLKAVKRSNIKTTEYDRLRQTFESRHLPMSTQLMIGLPGSTKESFKADLRFFFNQNIDVQIFRTVVLPNSPMAHPDYIREHGLIFEESGMLLETRLLNKEQLNEIEQLGRLFRCSHTYGMFRYWLCWLQWDYQLDPIDVLANLLQSCKDTSEPYLSKIWDRLSPPHDLLTTHADMREDLRANSQWQAFYESLKNWTIEQYPQILVSSELETVMQIQSAVMPCAEFGKTYQLQMQHDFVTYYQEQQQGIQKKLNSYPKGSLEISDPLKIGAESLINHLQLRQRPVVVWELQSVLSPVGTEADLFVKQSLAPRPSVA